MKLSIIPNGRTLRVASVLVLIAAGLVAAVYAAVQAQQGQGRMNSPHGAINIPCSNCHTTISWKPIRPFPDFNHATTKYPLEGMHAAVDCRQCHVNLAFSNAGSRCASCHADIHRRQMGNDCEQCHTARGWRELNRNVNGHQNRFPLLGAHAAAQCEDCHKSAAVGQFRGLSTECISCHDADYRSAKAIDHRAAGFSTKCETCHGSDSWSRGFDHQQLTGFALEGAHSSLACLQCHVGGKFAGTPASCVGCHLADYNSAADPNHVQAKFSQQCSLCHSSSTWGNATFDHANTKFPLMGAHSTRACVDCHKNGQYQGLSTACVSCHLSDFNGSTDPNHQTSNFPQTCEICHSTTAWSPALFNHNATQFPLTGRHAGLECVNCHKNGQYTGLSTNCVSCHLENYNGTTNPNHVAAGMPQTCATCHSTTAWSPAQFDHSATRFPLTGGHAGLECVNCHKNGQYTGLSTNCVSCHLENYNGTTNPNHAAAGMPQTCATCHSTTAWSPAQFDHSATQFPLTGGHSGRQCTDCHKNGQYTGLSTACVSCHLATYNSTSNPGHAAAGLTQDCVKCHSAAAWSPSIFDHSKAQFPLTGAHTGLQCSACHSSGKYANLPATCVSCHLTDFNGTTNPNHVTSAFPQDCTVCHNTAAWSPALFDHSKSQFPLTGAHTSLQCKACHSSGQYSNLPSSCVSCHLAKFNGATDPNHVTAGFPQDCTICHSTAAWRPSVFDHSRTAFPLTGAHSTVQCVNCHLSGVYAGTPTDCYSCHSSEYNSATNPNHAAAAFPRTCTQCHTTQTWSGAVFNHTRFPIYSGNHAGRWTTCGDCHTNAGNYTVFSCITCHEHNKTDMDSEHRGISNYVYNSANCYSCHPTGSSD